MQTPGGLESLADVVTFLSAAQHIRDLTIQLTELRNRRSRREHSLALQISCLTELCGDKAADNPYLAELWRKAQAELGVLGLVAPRPCTDRPAAAGEPCKGGST